MLRSKQYHALSKSIPLYKVLKADPANNTPSTPAPPDTHIARMPISPLRALKAIHPKSIESISRHAHIIFFKLSFRSSFVALILSADAFSGVASPEKAFE